MYVIVCAHLLNYYRIEISVNDSIFLEAAYPQILVGRV